MAPKPKAGAKGAKGKKGKKSKKAQKIIEDPKQVIKLLAASQTDDVETIKTLLEVKEKERKVDIKAPTGADALLRAVDSGARNAATTLMSYGVRPEVAEGRALHNAAAHNNLPMMEALLNREAENKVLDAAEAKAAKQKAKKKKKKGELPPPPLVAMPAPTTELTALHHSAMIGSLHAIALLLKRGANVNALTHDDMCGVYNGWAPLHFAADSGHLGCVRYLYQKGAILDLPTHEGETACALAAESGRWEVVKWLVSQGVDVRAARRGLELAQWALYGANSEALEFIVGYGGLPELNCRQTWFPPKCSLKDILVNEFSEPLCRKLDTAIYKGEVKCRERRARKEQIDATRWLVEVYNPRELDPDKAAATAVESFPPHIVQFIWLFEMENVPW